MAAALAVDMPAGWVAAEEALKGHLVWEQVAQAAARSISLAW